MAEDLATWRGKCPTSGRLDEASAVLDRAAERKLDIHEFIGLRHQIAFLKGDLKEMARIEALGEEKLGASDWVLDLEAGALAFGGGCANRG